jgi:putative protease
MRALELLAPAKNLECGMAAIDHGADAVYIGAQRFGARAAAGNSVADIARLCDYAHQFHAKVYVTVNTIIYDDELEDTYRLLDELSEIGVDAVLVQDMALTLHPSPFTLHLHASTQTDNRTPEKVRWLRDLGFRRVVLARELSIDEIRAIHEVVPDVELEVFVHGALCVSYSGLCYASQYCFHRSANRGECAQFCRMQFDLLDADGQVLEHDRHLLSLKDMCQIDNLEALADAGATSFKIEGRLKDVAYVKNVTAAYSERLNQIIRRHPDRYCRASLGHCRYTFTPNLQRTFNRGYTTYFANGRRRDIASFDTPKAMGEFVGTVKEIRRDSFNVAGTASFANGDGLCFLAPRTSHLAPHLIGFRVNRVEGNRLFPQHMPEGLRPGMRLYRNNDQEMERLLSKPSAERKIPITLSLQPTATGFRLSSGEVSVEMAIEHQVAEKPQRENIIRQLTKLGNTPYECSDVALPADFNYFIPSSQLAELRRLLISRFEVHLAPRESLPAPRTSHLAPRESYPQPHLYNIANREACAFYGIDRPTAYELHPAPDAMLMQCRHCLRYSLGFCPKQHHPSPAKPDSSPFTLHPSLKSPLYLRLGDGRRFRLEFDCRNCQMNVYASNT